MHSEQLKAIQTRQEAISKRSEYPEQIFLLTEITPEIYPSLTDFEKNVVQNQPEAVHIVDNALQTSISILFVEHQ